MQTHSTFAIVASAMALAAGCEAPFGRIGESPSVTTERADERSVPVLPATLNRLVPANGGLLRVDAEGRPDDPLLDEAARFYEAVDAPATFELWKRRFGFSPRAVDEPLDDHRRRTGVVTYYNRNELGLGRELACAAFPDPPGPAAPSGGGQQRLGLACYVTNYGALFGTERESLSQAIAGHNPRNTVAITYRPSMEPGYEVQFYTYDGGGAQSPWAQLDSLGPRPHPHICMSCHGGVYDDSKHLARHARFLPLDPNVVVFAEASAGALPSLTRSGQEERIRVINAASLVTPLAPGQVELVQELYGGSPEIPGTSSRLTWLPAGWRGAPDDEALFDRVLKPYCATCHLAVQQGLGGQRVATADMLRSPEELRRFPLLDVVCGTFGMPNAQPTSLAFWDARPVTLAAGAPPASSAADALLGWLGSDRQDCRGLGAISTCNRGADPDALCGNDTSGAACDLATGRCRATGYCQLSGRRRCPDTMACVPNPRPPAGLERFDGICQPAP